MNQTMRKTLAAGLTALAIAATPLTVTATQVTDFKDVKPSAWYYVAVDYAAREGLFSGTSKTTFSPEQAMTRGMFVTVLGNQAKVDGTARRSSFSDVSPTDYFAPFVEWAAGNGIVSGTGNGKFSPNESVTREQMAVILYRYVQSIDGDTSINNSALNKFPDANKVSGFALPAMQWAVTHGVLSGSDGKLLPQGTATRAQVAQVFMNARDLLKVPEESSDSAALTKIKAYLQAILPASCRWSEKALGAGWVGPYSLASEGSAKGVAEGCAYLLTERDGVVYDIYYVTEPQPGLFYCYYG